MVDIQISPPSAIALSAAGRRRHGDVISLHNNDLYDPTAVALFF